MKKMLFLIIILFTIFLLSSCKDMTNLTSEDYTIKKEIDINNYTIIVTPNTNITKLTIKLEFQNKNYEITYSDTITKTNLKKGNTYRYNFQYNLIYNLDTKHDEITIRGYKLFDCKNNQGILILLFTLIGIPIIIIIISSIIPNKNENNEKE